MKPCSPWVQSNSAKPRKGSAGFSGTEERSTFKTTGKKKIMDSAQINNLAARMKLTALTTGAWRATRLHRKETGIVNAAHHTTDAAKVHVKLTNSPALTALNKLHAEAYDAHRTLTLPSIQDGLRLLPAGRELQHSQKMHEFATQHEKLKAQFIAEYADEKASAPIRLNGLYDPAHWPSEYTVAAKFSFRTRYLACPAMGEWGEWIRESADAAEAELLERLTECLQRVADRCGEPEGKLYQTVFGNLAEVVALVPDLNFNANPKIATAAKAAQELAALNAETIRDAKAARREAADKAAGILAALGKQ